MTNRRFSTNIDIIKKIEFSIHEYDITFYTSSDNELFLDVVSRKQNSHNYIEGFLHHWDDSNDIKEDILPLISSVKNEFSINEFISSEISCAYVEKEITFFIHENDITKGKQEASKNSDRYIKTDIFEEIIIKWLEFLISQER